MRMIAFDRVRAAAARALDDAHEGKAEAVCAWARDHLAELIERSDQLEELEERVEDLEDELAMQDAADEGAGTAPAPSAGTTK